MIYFFTSLPTGASQILAKKLIKYPKLKIIDLSADFRLSNKDKFKNFYKFKHKASNLLKYSIYSLSEFVRKEIKNYKIIACPGCYQLLFNPLIPLFKGLIKKRI